MAEKIILKKKMKKYICIKGHKFVDVCFEIGDIKYVDCDGLGTTKFCCIVYSDPYIEDGVEYVEGAKLFEDEFKSYFMDLEEYIDIRNKKIDDILNGI
jgi:hypothetical protein